MAQVGCLGDIIFEVSSDVIKTFKNMQWSGSARWSTHQRHLYHALTEFTGLDPDTMSFDITFSAYLGISPMVELAKIWTYEREGKPLPLVIGEKAYGKYKWVITSHAVKMEHYDDNGDLLGATVSVKLLEYLDM